MGLPRRVDRAQDPTGRWEGTTCFVAGLPILFLAWNLQAHHLLRRMCRRRSHRCRSSGSDSPWWCSGLEEWLALDCLAALVRARGLPRRISYGLYAFHYPVLIGEWLSAFPYAFLIPVPWGAGLDHRLSAPPGGSSKGRSTG